ncbi:GM16121 [Drosophila sechellia]|uniref:GM16121 n=1 Tax=Drosophila sechellia TaxID=7238 RepID=B4III3_DROSE|nr:GM16121 [Drosophila sechellia]
MSSARTSSSQSQELLRKENYRFESSATGLDDDGDSNDIFCSTMKDPQDFPTFLSDECEIDSMDSLKKNKNPQNRSAKFTITAYADNAKDHFSDLEVNNLIDGNHKKNNIGVTLKAQQNQVQPVDKGLYVKESEKGSDHFICQQQKKNILETGELSEDDTSEEQKVRCAYKTSDLEDGEVSCEGLDVPHNLIKKTSLCQFDNTIFKKRNISVDKKLSTKTPLRNPPNVLPNAPKKPHSILESSYSIKKKQDRQKRLLMQLLRVEQQIAKKKKHRMKAFKE